MRITHHRWSHALVAGLLLAGCKFNKDKEAAPPAPAPATAQAEKPAAPAPAPITDATLSYLEPTADGKCRWMRHTPPGEPKAVSTLPFECNSVELSWSANGKEGLAFFRDIKPTVLRVDFETGKNTPLASLPTLGSLGTLGFDAQGRVVAIMSDEYVEDSEGVPASASAHLKMVTEGKGDDEKKFLVFEGQRYPAAMDGIPGLVHAFRLEGTTWKRFETKDSSFGWDYAEGHKAAAAYDALAPTSEKLSADEAKNSAVDGASPVLASLKKALPEKAKEEAAGEEGDEDLSMWVQIETAGGPLYLLQIPMGEFAALSGPVFMQGEKGLVQVEELGKDNTITVNARGDMLLFAVSDQEGKSAVKLWNAKTKKFVASLDGKQKTLTFWPKPSSSEAGSKAPVAGQTTP